jgi:hypothetical protein
LAEEFTEKYCTNGPYPIGRAWHQTLDFLKRERNADGQL